MFDSYQKSMKPLFNKDHSINLPGYIINKEISPSLFRRALSFVIDLYLAILIFLFPFSSIIATYMPKNNSFFSVMEIPPVITIIIMFFLFMFYVYLVLTQYLFGQSIGMIIMRINVKSSKNSKSNKSNNALWQYAVRNLFIFPFLPLSVIWMIELAHYMFYGYRFLERLSYTKTSTTTQFENLQQV